MTMRKALWAGMMLAVAIRNAVLLATASGGEFWFSLFVASVLFAFVINDIAEACREPRRATIDEAREKEATP